MNNNIVDIEIKNIETSIYNSLKYNNTTRNNIVYIKKYYELLDSNNNIKLDEFNTIYYKDKYKAKSLFEKIVLCQVFQ